MLIGLDFDNTLIHYGRVFRELALERGLVQPSVRPEQKAVRAHVWKYFDDMRWQELQAAVYGPFIGRGDFMEGAPEFLRKCRSRGIDLCIVSHKSEYASIDPGGVNLRQAALGWMEGRGFFLPVSRGGFGFVPSDIHFETTRLDKVARINSLGCSLFVDDLREVLDHPDLASSIRRVLFHESGDLTHEYALAGPWPVISEFVFPGAYESE